LLRTLRSRLLFTYLLVTGVVLGLVAVSLLFFLLRNPFAERQLLRQLDFVANLVTAREADSLAAVVPERLVRALVRIEQVRALRARALILAPDGSALADSAGDRAWLGDALRLEIASSGPGQGDFRVAGSRWLYAARSLGGKGLLVLAAPQPSVGNLATLLREFIPPLLQTCLVGLIVSLGLAWLTARGLSGPLQRMARAATAVSQGDLSARLEPEGPEEVRSLAIAFNDMVGRVQSSQQTQRDFLANVSHELRTPLTSIQGFAQAILDGAAAEEPSRKKAAQVILDESHRLRRLVEELLDLARYDAGQMHLERSPLDLGALLRSVADRLSPRAAEKHVRIELDLPPMSGVSGDGDRLAQVFTNLLDNAVKHSPAGAPVRVQGEAGRGWVAVHVEDRGPGIPAEEVSRIFERFYQLDKSRRGGEGRGAGLGLAISREIVQAHGGSLTVSSRVGEGSTFSVRLPALNPDASTQSRRRKAA
jgi:signal transduction histidine kinase